MAKKIVFFIVLFFNYTTTESSYSSEDEFNNYLISFFKPKENKKQNDSLEKRSTSNETTALNRISTSNNKISEEEFFSQLLANYNQKIITKKELQEKTVCKVTTDSQTTLEIHQTFVGKKSLPDNDCWLFARLGSAYKYTNKDDTQSVQNRSFATDPSTTATFFNDTPYQNNSSQTFESYEK